MGVGGEWGGVVKGGGRGWGGGRGRDGLRWRWRMASVWMYAKVMDWLSACDQKGCCVGCGEVRSCRGASVPRASDTWTFSTVLVNESSLLFAQYVA